MRRALNLAENGTGFVNPNPLVGAVIVKDDRIIGEGWHQRFGEKHAERNALANCSENPQGATMYVTLEPCCHYGKTPPCTEAIIENGLARVVVALQDPNPLMAGKGIEQLEKAGIRVSLGIGEDEAREQNRIFLKYITTRRPWVVLKTAMTLDGKIAASSGDSKWITGEESRAMVQELRARYMGIVAGIGTVEADNPLLNVRITHREVRQPVRLIIDSLARISLDSQLIHTALTYRTIIAHTGLAPVERLEKLREKGIETLYCENRDNGRVDLEDLMNKLGGQGIDSLLLEGGGELNFSFLESGLIDEVYAFIAPKIIGGRASKTPVEGEGLCKMEQAIGLTLKEVFMVGGDIVVHGEINERKSN